MCNDKQGIELYPATSAIEKTRASPLPPTSHTMPMLFGKTNARSSCDEQPAVMRLRVSTQHLHSLDTNTLVQQGRLEKRTRVYCHLPQVSACQVLLGSLKATILDPQVLTDGQLQPSLSNFVTSLLHFTSVCNTFDREFSENKEGGETDGPGSFETGHGQGNLAFNAIVLPDCIAVKYVLKGR